MSFDQRPYERNGYGMRNGQARDENGGPERSRRTNASVDDASIVKVIEVLAQSPRGWEDAARRAVAEASRTIDDIKSVYISDMQAIVEDREIVMYRVTAKISFALHPRR